MATYQVSPYPGPWVPQPPPPPQRYHFKLTEEQREEGNKHKARKQALDFIVQWTNAWEMTDDRHWIDKIREALQHLRNGKIEALGYKNNIKENDGLTEKLVIAEVKLLLFEFAVGTERWDLNKAHHLQYQIANSGLLVPYWNLGTEKINAAIDRHRLLQLKDYLNAKDVCINPMFALCFIMEMEGPSLREMPDEVNDFFTRIAIPNSQQAKDWLADEDNQRRLKQDLGQKLIDLQDTENKIREFSKTVVDGMGYIDVWHRLVEDIDFLNRLGITEGEYYGELNTLESNA